MSERHATGRCLCGAVTVTAAGIGTEISACHCTMCTRWSGAVQMGIAAPQAGATVSGPVKTYRSSRFAERAWCDTCGSAVWFRYVDGPDTDYFELAPGLFENAAGARLTCVVYADRAPDGFALAGDHEKVSQAEYEKHHPFVEGDPE